jgi:hypothetical protein
VTVITHMAVGAAVGSLVDGRGSAFLLGLATHVPLDIVPHYEFERMWVEAGIVAGVVFVMLALGMGNTAIFWGVLGAAAPDVENLLWRSGVIPDGKKVFPGHSSRLSKYFPHGRALGGRHAWTQVAIVCAAVLVAVIGARTGA